MAEGKPVEIGRLQRYATDAGMARNAHPYSRAPSTGRRVAVVGAGPAGLACAHRLSMHGHDVVVFDKRPSPAGSTNMGSRPTRCPTASRRRRWTGCCASAGSSCGWTGSSGAT
jgi:glutamate synthase (NADPH/NADH) small chain